MVPSLADHVHHLPVADLHDVLLVHLRETGAVGEGPTREEGNSAPLPPVPRPVSRRTEGNRGGFWNHKCSGGARGCSVVAAGQLTVAWCGGEGVPVTLCRAVSSCQAAGADSH